MLVKPQRIQNRLQKSSEKIREFSLMEFTYTKEHEKGRFDYLVLSQQQVSQVLSKQELARLLELRRMKKERTPKFQRQESWRYVRIHEPWRKPKGVDSHMRLSVKGWPALVKIGYRVPRSVRGLHPSGYRDVLVHNLVELETLSRDTDAARLAAGVGKRKRIELAKRAKELGIRVLNGRGLLLGQKVSETVEGEPEESKEQPPSVAESKAETATITKGRAKQRKPRLRKNPPRRKNLRRPKRNKRKRKVLKS